jgi:hypothetical protein
METKTSFTQAHLSYRLWSNELEFYREEIQILEEHIAEVLEKNNRTEVVEKGEQLRSQLVHYGSLVNQLESDLLSARNKMAIYAKEENGTDLDSVTVADHEEFKTQYESFQSDYQQLKQQLRRFESEWM